MNLRVHNDKESDDLYPEATASPHRSNRVCGDPAVLKGIATNWIPGSFYKGRWVPHDVYPGSSDGRGGWHLPATTSAFARQTLSGHRILLHGDSVVRQIFMRLVFHLRGKDADIYEHFFHVDAFYVANNTHDAFLIDEAFIETPDHYVRNATIHIFFLWDMDGMKTLFNPKPGPGHMDLPGYMKHGLSLRVAGIGYWLRDFKYAWDDEVGRYTSSMFKPIMEWITSNSSTTLPGANLYVLFPLQPHDNNHYGKGPRPSGLGLWLEDLDDFLVSKGLPFLPLKRIAELNTVARNSGWDLHFQCSFHAAFHEDINSMVRFRSGLPHERECESYSSL